VLLKKEHFPNDLLYLAFSFYKHYHNKPKSYYEMFEFCKLKEIDILIEDYSKRLSEMK